MSNYNDPLPGIWEAATKWDVALRRRCVDRMFEYSAIFERWYQAIRRDGKISDTQLNAVCHMRLSADGNTRAIIDGDSWTPSITIAGDLIRMRFSEKLLIEDAGGEFIRGRALIYGLMAATAEAYRETVVIPNRIPEREGPLWEKDAYSEEASSSDWFHGVTAASADLWTDSPRPINGLSRRAKSLLEHLHAVLIRSKEPFSRDGSQEAPTPVIHHDGLRDRVRGYSQRLAVMYNGYQFASDCAPLLNSKHKEAVRQFINQRLEVCDQIWAKVAAAHGGPLTMDAFSPQPPLVAETAA